MLNLFHSEYENRPLRVSRMSRFNLSQSPGPKCSGHFLGGRDVIILGGGDSNACSFSPRTLGFHDAT